MRARAGHSQTGVVRKGRIVHYIFSVSRNAWIPAGCAVGWPRCRRCRRPEEPELITNGFCNTCFYYHSLPAGEFWKRENDKFFPYNIGQMVMDALDTIPKDDGTRLASFDDTNLMAIELESMADQIPDLITMFGK